MCILSVRFAGPASPKSGRESSCALTLMGLAFGMGRYSGSNASTASKIWTPCRVVTRQLLEDGCLITPLQQCGSGWIQCISSNLHRQADCFLCSSLSSYILASYSIRTLTYVCRPKPPAEVARRRQVTAASRKAPSPGAAPRGHDSVSRPPSTGRREITGKKAYPILLSANCHVRKKAYQFLLSANCHVRSLCRQVGLGSLAAYSTCPRSCISLSNLRTPMFATPIAKSTFVHYILFKLPPFVSYFISTMC